MIGVVAACGDGDPYPVASGLYQLSTAQIDGDCKLDWALRPGPLAVGGVMPSAVVASAVSVHVQVCGHPAEDSSCTGLGTAFDFAMARERNELVGSRPIWPVPGCGMIDYQATLNVVGAVTGENALSLTWTAAIVTGDPGWNCGGYRPCRSTIEQRMAIETPGQ